MLDLLPDEILLYLFHYLDSRSLASAQRVCKQWYSISCEQEVKTKKKKRIINFFFFIILKSYGKIFLFKNLKLLESLHMKTIGEIFIMKQENKFLFKSID